MIPPWKLKDAELVDLLEFARPLALDKARISLVELRQSLLAFAFEYHMLMRTRKYP